MDRESSMYYMINRFTSRLHQVTYYDLPGNRDEDQEVDRNIGVNDNVIEPVGPEGRDNFFRRIERILANQLVHQRNETEDVQEGNKSGDGVLIDSEIKQGGSDRDQRGGEAGIPEPAFSIAVTDFAAIFGGRCVFHKLSR